MREAAARVQCQNNLKNIALALHGFHDTHHHFPAGTVAVDGLAAEKRLSWLASILPYIDQGALATQIHWESAWDAEENRGPVSTVIHSYQCPAHPGLATPASGQTHYLGLAGMGADAAHLSKDTPNVGFFGYTRRISSSDIKDGLSVTIAIMETATENGSWAAGGLATIRSLRTDDIPYIGEGRPFGVKHKTDTFFRSNPVMANAAFADGTVRSMPEHLPPETLRALVTIAGGEDVSLDF